MCHTVQASAQALLVNLAATKAVALQPMHNISHQWPTGRVTSRDHFTLTQTHGNVLTPALITSITARHTAHPGAATKGARESEYTSFNIKCMSAWFP